MKRLLFIILFVTTLSSSFPLDVFAKTNKDEFVRTANIFLQGGPLLDSHIEELSKFDILVLPEEDQVYNKPFFAKIRKLNPNIILLAYVATVSWNDKFWTDPLHQAMYLNIKPEWWLKDASGNQRSVWPNTRALNLNTGWTDYLAEHVQNDVLSTGLWDGVYYDEVQDSISWVGPTDVNQDGINDTASQADALWAQNYKRLFQITRALIGNDSIMVTNGSSNPDFAPYVNGRMFETFPSSKDTIAEWKNMMQEYLKVESQVGYPAIDIINVNTHNTGTQNDYQSMRFGLTTTLLGNGYFGFDYGSNDHGQLWTYDEYNASLGKAKGSSSNSQAGSGDPTHNKEIWQREFERGQVVVNGTNNSQTISLNGDYEKLHGTQDPNVNDGSIVSEVTVAGRDGIILLRPIDGIANATFRNGAFARVFDRDGKTKRNGFFAYDSAFRGGIQIIHTDYNHDGKLDTITADKTFVRVFDASGSLHASFAPYGETYTKNVNIAAGDLNNDGSLEIVTGTQNGASPLVKIFDTSGNVINTGFLAYDKKFRGGAHIAIGDVDGDGKKEIITSPAALGTAHIRIFNTAGKPITPGFFAYEQKFRGGAYIASADLNGDGTDEIITGKGLGGAPNVRVFDRNGKMKSDFYAGDRKQKNGVKIAASDLDGDGTAEIIALTTDVFTLSVFR